MTNNENELMPCPFCGGTDISKSTKCFGHGDYDPQLNCKCGASMSTYGEDAVKAWNTRPQPSADVSEAFQEPIRRLYECIDIAEGCMKKHQTDEWYRKGFEHIAFDIDRSLSQIRQALTQPKAVDVDELKGIVSRACWSATERTSPQTVDDAMECVKYWFSELLNEQGYLNTNERVQELEERLEISPDHPYDGIYCRDESIKLLEQTNQGLKHQLKVATEALEFYAENNNWTGWEFEDEWGEFVKVEPPIGDDIGNAAQKALQQINGVRDD